ncbi:DUF2157 domain-containing protein [Pseudalkalibacillus sp. Hm43]|uniref:DUF2157 domain-containing protein n=1 Tax=Pseudalkalibacillus sp. Hm43 TaxID=3450742 RepID=UPI003F4344C7
MNERKWLKKEGAKWIEKGLIEEDQLNGIISLYEKKSSNLLPILASLLIGLGVLTFIASNWGQMSDLFRFSLICAAIIGFNLTGLYLLGKDKRTLGIAWIGIGTLTFGAGIFLTAQIFHIVSYSANAFVLWTLIALLTYFILPNRYFYLLTLVIGTAGLIYSAVSFQSFSFILALLVVIGVGIITLKENESLFYHLYAGALTITGITFLVGYDLTYIWMTIVFLFIYAMSEWVPAEKAQFAYKNISLLGVVILTLVHVFLLEDMIRYNENIIPASLPYFILLLITIGLISWSKYRRPSESHWIDLILFAPLFLIGETAGVFYLLLVFGYSLYILVEGYKLEDSTQINRGTFLFLISTLVAYIQLAWDFLPKSMFFLAGGILLFLLSWYLERRRRKWVHEAKGGQS